MEVPPVNGKENTKSITLKKKVILVWDSIVSGKSLGKKGKSLSKDKFMTVVSKIPGEISDDITQFFLQRKTLNN